MTQKTVKILVIILCCIALAIYGYLKLTHFFEIDSCLDSGGRWNHEKSECELSTSQGRFDTTILSDKRFANGHEYGTHQLIKPKTFHFNNYTFVTGFPNDSGVASLGLYRENKELFYVVASDGFYDTVMTANLNNDGVPDFLVSYAYEDGASLSALISISETNFIQKKLFDEWHETYCGVGGDTLQYILPIQIRDINHDGKDDVIVNLVRINNKTFAISCTDTVFADRIR